MPDYESYGIMIKEYSENQIAVIGEWIRKNIRPGRLISEYDSCALKQLLEIDTGICLTNDTVKQCYWQDSVRNAPGMRIGDFVSCL